MVGAWVRMVVRDGDKWANKKHAQGMVAENE